MKIERKSLLRKTKVEYGDYAINHVQGCSHGCLYPCYAFVMAKRFGVVKDYNEWIEPKLVSNALQLLEKELKRKRHIGFVNMCFTTDPFMYGKPEVAEASMDIIRMLNKNGKRAVILTKGTLPEELKEYNMNMYGISLISLNEEFRKKMEPGSAPYEERIESLRKLHKSGLQTWVSIEPYPTPNIIEQDIEEILDAVAFVKAIVFGRLHYNSMVEDYDGYQEYYNRIAAKVAKVCEKLRITYYIKEKTLKYPPLRQV